MSFEQGMMGIPTGGAMNAAGLIYYAGMQDKDKKKTEQTQQTPQEISKPVEYPNQDFIAVGLWLFICLAFGGLIRG